MVSYILYNELEIKNERMRMDINNIKSKKQSTKIIKYINNKPEKQSTFSYIPDNNTDNSINLQLSDSSENNINSYLESLNNSFFNNEQNQILSEERKNEINLMIKLTLKSNNIEENSIISLFMNNLNNYKKTIDTFANEFLKLKDHSDLDLIYLYFKKISLDEKEKFNINFIFIEIKSFFDENLNYFDIKDFLLQKKNLINEIINECKLIDKNNSGFIDTYQLKDIINKVNINEEKEQLYNSLIYIMKKYQNIIEIKLFDLYYINLTEELKNDLSEESNKKELYDINILNLKSHENQKIKEEVKAIRRFTISNFDNSKDSRNQCGFLNSQIYSFNFTSRSSSLDNSKIKEEKEIKEEKDNKLVNLENIVKEFISEIFKASLQAAKNYFL